MMIFKLSRYCVDEFIQNSGRQLIMPKFKYTMLNKSTALYTEWNHANTRKNSLP